MIGISDKEFNQLANFIKCNYGINLKDEKKTLVTGRLNNVLVENNFKSFSQYIDYVMTDKTGKAAIILLNKITTNHTFFMRESNHFNYFKEIVLPFWTKASFKKDLRIWSAGCSSGEEPYTLAMITDEYLGNEKAIWDAKILATDISTKSLGLAVEGKYNNEEVEMLPVTWRINYFDKLDNQKYSIKDKIRKEVIYRRFNLMEEVFPFKKKFHVIFCRNVMIYFDNDTKNALVDKFYNSLEYGGYLFIGHSESLNRDKTKFKYIKPAVYRKE
ncbi:protein-glutamate O-methyltransferase CheR [Clostridium sp. YIM B02505]|uniref:protein-glutamate O-methyltransferase n=1 Tax=Clostridium yunnanense TaxID=2800325 RepID=A0ABS1EM41_9CLOT|nr:protein-glutamate O-methyltransferase CheR [Clostridium yunnanense]MBK1810473.1 protein-glutamate O-methyltransferase CheR [Clostridium yunnanense]